MTLLSEEGVTDATYLFFNQTEPVSTIVDNPNSLKTIEVNVSNVELIKNGKFNLFWKLRQRDLTVKGTMLITGISFS